MLRSLYSGVSGVKGHQTYLDVIGNNIANVNTTGFKKSNVLFQDLLYQSNRGAMAPDSDAGRGGINPMQVGLGVNIAAIETIHTQGPMQYTGNRNDMAISGDGYFVVKDGQKLLYTRAGATTLDGAGNMVMSGTGYMYQGYKMEQDPTDPTKYLEGSLESVNIPVGQKLEAQATSLAGYRCNLDSRVPTYLPMGVIGNDASVTVNLGANSYVLDSITEDATNPPDPTRFMVLSNAGGDEIALAFTGVDPTSGLPILTPTVTNMGGATATYDSATGRLTITEALPGTATQTLELKGLMNYTVVTDTTVTPNTRYLAEFTDSNTAVPPIQAGYRQLRLWGPGAAALGPITVPVEPDGKFNLPNTAIGGFTAQSTADGTGIEIRSGTTLLTTLNQKISSVHASKMDVYDTLGNPHTLEVSWEKIDNNQWRWRAWLPDEPGVTLTNSTGVINFTSEGKIEGTDTFDLGLNFASIGAEDATIKLDFSGRSFNKEPIEGITQYGSAFTTKAYYQDGYAMGVLEDYAVGADGTVEGVYSNSQRRPLYRMALALFANPQGLNKEGDTVFSESANSGLAQVVKPQEGGAGKIQGSNLEMANVDLSQEFVNLIVAQRGFQANARVITTSDQVLEELINLKR
ncbi:flagellar hook protein FlgE [Aminomonas paucivorans]|uniref:flagellar hook protein FlgE n=1 Tax=Aminomonas paucivorans TaxID=81412 RepID=UPI00332ADD6C